MYVRLAIGFAAAAGLAATPGCSPAAAVSSDAARLGGPAEEPFADLIGTRCVVTFRPDVLGIAGDRGGEVDAYVTIRSGSYTTSGSQNALVGHLRAVTEDWIILEDPGEREFISRETVLHLRAVNLPFKER